MGANSNNQSPVDLSVCDREPIQVPDAIQPHGCVVVADPQSREILQISANIGDYPGLGLADAVGRVLDDVLPEPILRELEATGELSEAYPPHRCDLELVSRDGGAVPVMVSFFRSGPRLVVEVEAYPARSETTGTIFRALEHFLWELRSITTSMGVLQAAVDEVARCTGYDHAMAYRFDKDWNGEVIAEQRRSDQHSFLGHCFPASDIPAQARALYAINPIRHTPDVDYEPVPLGPSAGQSLDMTWLSCRSISPVHREYMRNMGVYSSLSLSLMVDGRLWGMILCHHATAHPISPMLRSYLQMLAQVTGDTLRVSIQKEIESDAEAIGARMRRVLSELDHENESLLAALEKREELLEAFGADALLVRLHGQKIAIGREAPSGVMTLVEQEVAEEAREAPVFSDRIGERIPVLNDPTRRDWLGGFLYARLSSGRDDALLFLRAERIREETWAGDPDEPRRVEDEGGIPRIHPRRSFEAWRKEVRGCSLPWSEGHAMAAERLMNGLARHLAGEVERLLRHRANHDALTQLPNRALLDDRLREVFRRAKRTNEKVVVLFLDLDGFKPVNDQYGHEVGDRILQVVAQRFDDVLRDADTVARVGGDEFVFLLEGFKDLDSARDDGAACAERLVSELEALRFEYDDIRLSCSIGIAIYPLDGGAPDSLLRAADEAMYSIKGRPGQRYTFASAL